MSRTDTGQRLIAASPERLYAAYVDPDAIAAWRPPEGMTARIEAFDPREGGGYRMAFVYEDAATAGKSGDNVDLFEGRFVELVPGRRIVEQVDFDSPDPAFAGTMTITTTFEPAEGGTLVSVACADVPPGISQADHEEGIASSLANLASFVE
ncbi:ATPase [Caulobacter sp. SLTY]|uniref:SRPBCC domain-containing protein n=1 Tax=Caulobacter sp. SLTY TaxID=2683262 RepID=UPI001412749E|nr:ATPase [Caulobacter sp. SLTY]